MVKIHETKKYILYRDISEKGDNVIMESKKTGKLCYMDTKTFIKTAENCINEVKKYD